MQEEIASVNAKYNDELTAEGVAELNYMELALHETLRLHSPVLAMIRLCTKQFNLPPQYPDGKKDLTVTPTTPIIIPVHALHMDPEIFPKPHIFNPDRFNEENRQQRHKYAYLAFGEGPRICLGMKFAMLQVKTALAAILSNFDVKLSSKTVEPLPISAKSFLLACETGIWVNFIDRRK